MDITNNMAIRLLQERRRLGLLQRELAESIGSSRVSIVKYEKGKTLPSAEALAGFHKAGMDVVYILTGERAINMKDIRKRFKEAYGEVERQLETSDDEISRSRRLEMYWCVYDAYTRIGRF